VDGSYECCYEPSGSIMAGKFLNGYTTGGLLSSAELH
jgi:hypothetical protein